MEEESEIPPVEEQLAPETVKPTKLNKNGQPRKQLTPEAKEKLAKARAKANAIRQQTYAKKLDIKLKVAKEKSVDQNSIPEEEKPLTETTDEAPEPEPAEVKDVVDEKVKHSVASNDREGVKPKGKGKKKTKIIVEQSSDDSDEFEPNDHVVFVKRVSRKKKEPVKEPEPPQAPPPPPEPPPVVRQPTELTPQQRILKSQYESMFSGGLMNKGNLRRRHY